MARENIRFYEYGDGSYNMVDTNLYGRFFEYEDSCNYYDIDVDKILVYKQSNNEYLIGYNGVNKMDVVPLQLRINSFYCEIYEPKNNDTFMLIKTDDKELFKKIREIWNKIIELIGINNAKDFVKNTNTNNDEFIRADIHKKTSVVKDNYEHELVIVLHSVIDNYLKTSLVQVKMYLLTILMSIQ